MQSSVIRWVQLAVVACLMTALSAGVKAQTTVAVNAPSLGPDSERAQVLLLGTFHFQDAGLDDYQPQEDIDIMSPRRQDELGQLLRTLEIFRPTKILVEWPAEHQSALDAAYSRYRAGELELDANEIHQIGFRLAHGLGHERLWAIDAPGRWYDETVSTEVLIERALALGQTELVGRAIDWMDRYQEFHTQVDMMKSEISLVDYLLYLNSPEYLRALHGQYLVGQIEVGGHGDYIGADMRTAWYNRNIRIFTNIQRSVAGTKERMLVIIGAGHVPILQHLLASSPEFHLVDLAEHIGTR